MTFCYNMYSYWSYTNDSFQVKWKSWRLAGSWAPGSLGDDGWAGSGDLTLRVSPADTCLFSWAWALVGGPSLGAGWKLPSSWLGPRTPMALLKAFWVFQGIWGAPDILKDDAVKVLPSIGQQIWKIQQWPQDWKSQLSFQYQRKWMPKNVPTMAQLHSSHTLAKWCSKSSKVGFNSTWTETFQMFKLHLEKGKEPEIKLWTSIGS